MKKPPLPKGRKRAKAWAVVSQRGRVEYVLHTDDWAWIYGVFPRKNYAMEAAKKSSQKFKVVPVEITYELP